MGEDEVTLTSWLHAQAERTKKTEERRGGYMATSDVGSDKGPEPGDDAQSRGRPARGRGLCRRPERRLIHPFPSPLQDISFAVPSDAPWQLRPCRI